MTDAATNEARDAIAHLHVLLVDAVEGYEEGVDLAEDAEVRALFSDLRDRHRAHAEALAAIVRDAGGAVDQDGSALQYVHKAILRVRSAVTGLGKNVLPSIQDGEERLLTAYDETIAAAGAAPEAAATLTRQRAVVGERIRAIAEMASRRVEA